MNQCSGHGTCDMGWCSCDPGWFGQDCAYRVAGTPWSPGGLGACHHHPDVCHAHNTCAWWLMAGRQAGRHASLGWEAVRQPVATCTLAPWQGARAPLLRFLLRLGQQPAAHSALPHRAGAASALAEAPRPHAGGPGPPTQALPHAAAHLHLWSVGGWSRGHTWGSGRCWPQGPCPCRMKFFLNHTKQHLSQMLHPVDAPIPHRRRWQRPLPGCSPAPSPCGAPPQSCPPCTTPTSFSTGETRSPAPTACLTTTMTVRASAARWPCTAPALPSGPARCLLLAARLRLGGVRGCVWLPARVVCPCESQ